MKKLKALFLIPIILLLLACQSGDKSETIKVQNQTDAFLKDVFIIKTLNTDLKNFILKDGETEIPFQIINDEGLKIGFVLDLAANEEKTLTLVPVENKKEYKTRTYAELSMKQGNIYYDGRFRGDKFENVTKIKVPSIHTDHDALFRYEGPGWESELVGYRFYLDWRNATDIFGKKVNELLLHNVGIHDTVAKDDSYHSMQEWGMDIFKVGSSLGIGSVALWQNGKVNMVSKTDSVYCEIRENGPVRSRIKTNYFGWLIGENKYDLECDFSITAGSRLTKVDLHIKDADSLATGLAKYKGTNFIKSKIEGEWSYIALYGSQTLVNETDKLGIAIFYKTSSILQLTEDELSHILVLKPENDKAEYYFCAAWEQEPNGVTNEADFINYLNITQIELNNPPLIK
ncbi:MAG: DUF4861 family protein [Ignavibacteriales bacterium]|nr:MAG: DUF4861 family protein [Ignavibacteriales bacterium]